MLQVPQRFADKILSHVLGVSLFAGFPQVLAVQGNVGTGKSFQIRAVARSVGLEVVTHDATSISGRHEGDSVAAIEDIIQSCREAVTIGKEGSHCALILDDFDLSVAGKRSDSEYTVNSQLLSGHLLGLVDNPQSCIMPNDFRLPIFLTSNDLTPLHGALTRPGRMEVFTWEPSGDELAQMVFSFLSGAGVLVDEARVTELVSKVDPLTIAEVAASVHRIQAARAYSLSKSMDRFNLDEIEKKLKDERWDILDEVAQDLTDGEVTELRRPRSFLRWGRS